MSFGQELAQLLKTRGMKRTALANLMAVTPAYVSQLVTGFRNPGKSTLLKLSKSLNVPLDILLTFTAESFATKDIPRKVPVLNDIALRRWLDSKIISKPAFVTQIFEYALTDDPYAFYLITDDLKLSCGISKCDLILIEPITEIRNGNMVMVYSRGEFYLREVSMKDNAMLFVNFKKNAELFLNDNANHKFFRVKQCIRTFK